MSDALSIAASGMKAQALRIEASASNVSNLRVTGTLPSAGTNGQPQAYAPIGVSQTSQATAGGEGTGTRAVFTPITPSWVAEVEVDSPYANGDGLVAAPNVDLAKEQINQIVASRAYEANASVIKTADDMTRDTLDIKT